MPSFAVALKKAVCLPHETTKTFQELYKALSDADKLWYYAAMQAEGIECDPPKVATPA